jgi:DNA-directed RNA polymerase
LRGLASLNSEESGGAQNWLALFGDEGMPRKLSKKPVMTLPYGSTQQACTETIFRWSQENAPDFFEATTGFRHALYLSPKLWSSISEVVIAARAAMDWLQECSGVLAKAGHPIQYKTPLGFPVRQATKKFKTRKIETQIGGRLQIRFATDTDDLDSRKQRQGSSPNFVHSIDATHMMMVINASVAAGINSFAMIHDDFGVHACHVSKFHRIIREEFVRLHSSDLLRSFKEQHEEQFGVTLPDLPPVGDLDIGEVLQSPYFFG